VANPPGTQANRWNQVVSAVASELAITTAAADTWLNGVWANMYVDEKFGNPLAHDALKKWLEANRVPGIVTLPSALRNFVT
jgi:hypothetical protein